MKSQLEDLQREIKECEALRSGKRKVVTLGSLEEDVSVTVVCESQVRFHQGAKFLPSIPLNAIEVQPLSGSPKSLSPHLKVPLVFRDHCRSYSGRAYRNETIAKMCLEIELAELLGQVKKHAPAQ
jgi:hypothetical protein